MIRFNEDFLRDRIYACWIGKNIGGTMGGPYECKTEMNDIKGFSTKPGKPLPNDDLDLQLVWLKAVDEMSPQGVNAKVLGEYWLSYISPAWNEYGVSKANMRDGIVPPMSGELNNEEWKNSNGAWIRTEVWACLYPANVEEAIRFAFEDACVDHGFAEGTYAAIFIAAIESAAFVINDIDMLLDIGLSKIPADCRVARGVKVVREAYKKGVDWKETRQLVLDDCLDLGWFQAPANVAFAVIGLLYGEGDFKKTMIITINCGDDTDCTAATVGSILGIMGGTKAIPSDWQEYIGDEIVTISVVPLSPFPKTCKELTDCVMNLLPTTLRTSNNDLLKHGERKYEITIEQNDFSSISNDKFMGRQFVENFLSRTKYSFSDENVFVKALVEFEGEPVIMSGESISGQISLKLLRMNDQKRFSINWHLPEGWGIEGGRSLHVNAMQSTFTENAKTNFTITAGEKVYGNNEIILEVKCKGRYTPLLIPIVLLG